MLVALTGDGMLITSPAEHPGDARTRKPSGVSGQPIGLDRRPANGLLYGLTAAGDVYTIDPVTAAASLVSTLTVPFNGGSRSGLDFNPRTDPLRLGGHHGQKLPLNRGNSRDGADRALAHARADPHFGPQPPIAGTDATHK